MANEKVTKQVAIDKANYEFIQSVYGGLTPSVLFNILLESLREELEFRNISLNDIKKSVVKTADEKLRNL